MVKVVNFVTLDPSGNITALVVDEVKKDMYKKINEAIIQAYPEVEQVGFLTQVEYDGEKIWKLEMAGGEFCGNASRSFACYLYDKKLVDKTDFLIMCSGNNNLLQAKIVIKKSNDKEKAYYAQIIIPFNKTENAVMSTKTLSKSFQEKIGKKSEKDTIVNIVSLEGITHCLINKDQLSISNNIDIEKENTISIIKELDLQNEPAVGVIWCDEKNDKIYPFVCVKSENKVYYEHSCGSGSIAYGIHRCFLKKQNEIDVIQRSDDVVNVKVEFSNDFQVIKNASLSGITKILKERFISC